MPDNPFRISTSLASKAMDVSPQRKWRKSCCGVTWWRTPPRPRTNFQVMLFSAPCCSSRFYPMQNYTGTMRNAVTINGGSVPFLLKKLGYFITFVTANHFIMAKITVMNTNITVINYSDHDYISLTDMASAKDGDSRAADVIKNWIRNRYTIEFLGTWEMIHNPNFKVVEFDHFRMQAGLPSFVLSTSEWIERTHAVGIMVKKGRYGGTYASSLIERIVSRN